MSPLLRRLSTRISPHLRNLRHLSNINSFSSTSFASPNQNQTPSSSIFPYNQLQQARLPKDEKSIVTHKAIPNSPWTVVDFDKTTKLLFLVSEKQQLYYPVRTPVSLWNKATRCLGSCFGWLIMGDSLSWERSIRLFLWNPFTHDRIQLPPYTRRCVGDVKVILSSDPNITTRPLVVFKDYQGNLSFCRLGDKAWTMSDLCSGWHDIIFYKGVMYGVQDYGRIDDCAKMFTVDSGLHKSTLTLELEKLKGRELAYFLVESEGELLLVSKCVHHCYRESLCHGNGVPYYEKVHPDPHAHYKSVSRACRFGVSKYDSEAHCEVELTNLSDRMLLLDSACSVTVDATEFSEFKFRPNCIYYTNRGYYDDYGWHEFSLEDGKIVPFGEDFSSIHPIPPLS